MDYAKEITAISSALGEHTTPIAGVTGRLSASAVARTIDHTLLKLDATPAQIDTLCTEALTYHFKTVCVRANYVAQAQARLKGSDVGVCCVVGFHEGTYSVDEKLKEAQSAIAAGASELDTVLNRAHVGAGTDYAALAAELTALRSAASGSTTLKLILETARLTQDQTIATTVVAYHCGLDFVKTSTGFDGEGATVGNVALMRRVADVLEKAHGRHMAVKASGGVRTYEDAKRMIEAGAARLGASAGVAIVQQAKGEHVESNVPAGGY